MKDNRRKLITFWGKFVQTFAGQIPSLQIEGSIGKYASSTVQISIV